MGEVNAKEKRAHIRIPIISGLIEYYASNASYEHGSLVNISLSGCFIERLVPMEPKASISLIFRLPGTLGLFEVAGKVIWVRWAKRKASKQRLGFGVEFKMDLSKQKTMEAYILYLKNYQILQVAQSLNGPYFQPPPNKPTP